MSLLQTSGLSLSDAVDCSNHLYENRAQQGELARVGRGAVKKRAHASHDVLVESRLEKLNGVERALGVCKQLFVFFRCRRGRILAWWSERPGRVGSGEMQLIERDQHRLREIERSVIRRRYSDHQVRSIEYLVRQPLVLPAEQERDFVI